ncbi:MAG: methyltransferase domain-containing protein [Actinomycetota bacterium]|nr:methyltransferase domain-containing protein [Actinomycetota bacterium]
MDESLVRIGDEIYRVVYPAAADALIDEEDFDNEESLPYWAELWPSAVALARHIHEEDLTGKRTIELGCGVGLPTIVALRRGARALATDHYEAALDFVRHNAGINGSPEPRTALLDWHAPEDMTETFDLVLATDVLYEQRNAEALAKLIPRLLASGGEALVADPGRRWEPLFREVIHEAGLAFSTESVFVEQESRDVKVVLHRLSRPGS